MTTHIAWLVLVASLVSTVTAGETIRVSVDSMGTESDLGSYIPSISGDGRYIAFSSSASNLVIDDNNGFIPDVFLHDRINGTTLRVSVSSAGVESNDSSSTPSISANGRYVAFRSLASNLVEADSNERDDIFLHDLNVRSTTRVSISSEGVEGNNWSEQPSVSADGRFIAFRSAASNLVLGDNNRATDIFVHDQVEGITTRVSVNSIGDEGKSDSLRPSISADGRYVAFLSIAGNLVSDDSNNEADVFVHDRKEKKTKRVSISSEGVESNGFSQTLSISADGRYVAFESFASNLISDDNNLQVDVFIHDRVLGVTTRISVDSEGVGGDGYSSFPSISADGRHVTFNSEASNLVVDDNNVVADVFVRDRTDGLTTRVSVGTGEAESNGYSSGSIAISADGRYLAFESGASNLVLDDNNQDSDIFQRDRGAECDIDDPSNNIVLYDNAWSMVAPPCLPESGATVEAIFADDIPGELFDGTNSSTATWAVWIFDGITQHYSLGTANTLLASGMGVWVLQSTGDDREVDLPNGSRSGSSNFLARNTCSPRSIGCFPLRLNNLDSGNPVWTLSGMPFSIKHGVAFSNLRIVTDTGVCADSENGCLLDKANVEQIVSDIFYRYNNHSEDYENVKKDSNLRIWDAFWIRLYPEAGPLNPTVLIPEYRAARID